MYVVPLHSCKSLILVIVIIITIIVIITIIIIIIIIIIQHFFFPFFQVQDLCRKNNVGDYVVIP